MRSANLSYTKNSVWTFFSSVKLTIGLLTIIALASILGTVIPQQEASQTLVNRLTPGMISVLQKLQLFDIFHSVWFMTLMALLAINLIVCSVNRLPVSWKLFRGISAPDKEASFKDPPPDQTIFSARSVDEEATYVEGIVKKMFKRVRREETDRGIFFTGEKGNTSYLGVYVIHCSILIILAGVIIGFLFGFDGYMELGEGETGNTIHLKGGKDFKKLDFAVRCDRFTVEYYQDGTPKVYRSELSFTKNGSPLQQSVILVNHPASFEGTRFYQASYGTASSGEAIIVIRKGLNQIREITVAAGSEFDLPGKEGKAKIIRMEANFMGMGPAVKVQIAAARGNVQFWIFQNIDAIEEANPGLRKHVPMFNPGLFAPYVFSLATILPKHYTGLQVNNDPGVPIVIGGSFLLVAGFILVFFHAHRRIRIRIDREDTKTRIIVSGKTNRDTVGLDREISRLVGEIRNVEGQA